MKVQIVDIPRLRSPLLHDLYSHLSRRYSSIFDYSTYPFPLESYCEDIIPDNLWLGFNMKGYLKHNEKFIKENDIKIWAEGLDPVMWEQTVSDFEGFDIDSLVFHQIESKDPHMEPIKDWCKENGTDIFYIPWAADPKDYYWDLEKDIDINYICTIYDVQRDSDRKTVRDMLLKIRNSEIVIGDCYIQFAELLNRSKILVTAGKQEHCVTQKYVQGAMAGCLLVGEIPIQGGEVFTHDTMAGVEMGEYGNLNDILNYYTNSEDERLEMANRCRERVLEERTLKRVCDNFVERLL